MNFYVEPNCGNLISFSLSSLYVILLSQIIDTIWFTFFFYIKILHSISSIIFVLTQNSVHLCITFISKHSIPLCMSIDWTRYIYYNRPTFIVFKSPFALRYLLQDNPHSSLLRFKDCFTVPIITNFQPYPAY